MAVPENFEPDVWRQARDLLLRWEVLNGELDKSLAVGSAENLLLLNKERQQLRDRLDVLRQGCGTAAWSEGLIQGRPSTVQAEIRIIIERLVVENEQIRRELLTRMSSLQQKIAGIRQARASKHSYQGCRRAIKGAFIDTSR